MAWPARYPVNAGDLLFGPMIDVLKNYFREKRARAEREDVRRQAKEEYDQHIARLQQQAALNAQQAMFGMTTGLAGIPAQQAQEIASSPQTVSYLQALQGQAGQPQVGWGPGTMVPSPGVGPPAPPTIQGPAVGPPQEVFDPRYAGLEALQYPTMQVPRPGAPPGGGYEEAQGLPPTNSYFAQLQQRAEREKAATGAKKEGGAAMEFAKILAKVDPIEAAKVAGQHLGMPGETTATPDVPTHIAEAERRAAERRQHELDVAKAKAAGRKGAGRREPPTKLLPKDRLDRLVRGRDRENFITEAGAGTVLPGLKGAPPEKLAATYDNLVDDSVNESLRKAKQAMGSAAVRSKDAALRAAQAAKREARKIPDWNGGKAAVEKAELEEKQAQQDLDDERDKYLLESSMTPADRALRDLK